MLESWPFALLRVFRIFAGIPLCAGGGTRTHTRLPSPDFESDKECGMLRDAALRGAFVGLVAYVGGMVRVRVRPDCHQNSHHVSSTKARDYGPEVGYYTAVK